MSTGLVSDERYFWIELIPSLALDEFTQPFASWDSPEGKRRILSLIRVSGVMEHLTEIEPRMATEEELLRFHSREYVDKVKSTSERDGGEVGPFTGLCKGGYDITRLAAGGCITAFDAVISGEVQNAFALVRPCGHHAERDYALGMAIFCNVALAVMHAKAVHGIRRVAIIDWDVHHGNGTQSAFYSDPSVLTISIHQDRLFPQDTGFIDETGEGDGKGYNINVPLPPGSGHATYIETFRRVVLPALHVFKPDMIAVASGFDASGLDPLGRMMCHSDTYREMTTLTKEAAEKLCDGRLVICLEGGYAPSYIPYCGLAVVDALVGVRTEVRESLGDWIKEFGGQDLQPAQSEIIEKAAELISLM